MLAELHWSRSDFTLPRTIGQFVMAFVGFFIGVHVDRFGPQRFQAAGLLVLGCAIYLCSQVQSVGGWILINGVLLTAGSALIGNLVVNVTLSKWFVEKRGSAVAWAAMGVSFAGLTITPGITWAIDIVGWREAWQWLALVSVLVMVPVAAMMRRAPEDHGLHPDGKTDAQVLGGQAQKAADDFSMSMTRAEAVRTPSFYLLAVSFGIFSAGIGVMLLQTIPYLTDANVSRVNAAFMITVASIPAMLTKPLWGYVIDQLEAPRRLAALSATITGVATGLIAWGQMEASMPLLYAGYITLGMGWGGMIPLQEVIWAGYFGRRYLGEVRSAALPIALAMGASGPWLSSWYYDLVGNYDGAFVSVALLNVLAAVLIYFTGKPK